VKREHNKSCTPRPQAMAAYRTAARLFPGLAAPLAGLGTEYARLNNMPLAEHMFAAATRRAPIGQLYNSRQQPSDQ
jgi:anaphase-promoting complex subunit 6